MLPLADDAILETSTGVSDDKWHLIQYQRNETKALLIVDRKEKVENKTKNNGYTKMDYDQHLNIGVSNYRYPFDITLQDFIWEYDGKNVNFVNGLFDLYHGKNNKYMVIPKGALPKFNEKLPPTLSSYPPVAHKTIPEKCFDTGEVTCSSTPGM